MAFGKGTRSILGKNLAYAELVLAMAGIVRAFPHDKWEFVEGTGREDVETAQDTIIPSPRKGRKGVMVRIRQ